MVIFMKKIDKHIEIVRSTRSTLNSMGQKSSDDIVAVLSKHYTKVGVSIVADLSDLKAVVATKPDLVFLGMKFIPTDQVLGLQDPNKVWVAEYLDNHNIAYTGSNQITHELEITKSLAKQKVTALGLKTSPFHVVKNNGSFSLDDICINFPLFVKPTSRGGGQGIDSDSVATCYEELDSKVRAIAAKFQSDSLIEEYLTGREFSVAILEDRRSVGFFVMPLELIAPLDNKGQRILSGQIKFADTERSMEVTDSIVRLEVCALAIDAFRALGARDYGRIDIRLDKNGIPHFLEANLMPSLKRSAGNYFPKACALNIGLEYEEMILELTELGLSRNQTVSMRQVLPDIESKQLEPFTVALETI